ncbi:hypothetical protein C7256_24845 [Enterocloster lavalensis]|nr:hypothetical protein C7256_24845 [Enterocloster lavalensis]
MPAAGECLRIIAFRERNGPPALPAARHIRWRCLRPAASAGGVCCQPHSLALPAASHICRRCLRPATSAVAACARRIRRTGKEIANV